MEFGQTKQYKRKSVKNLDNLISIICAQCRHWIYHPHTDSMIWFLQFIWNCYSSFIRLAAIFHISTTYTGTWSVYSIKPHIHFRNRTHGFNMYRHQFSFSFSHNSIIPFVLVMCNQISSTFDSSLHFSVHGNRIVLL